MRKRKSLKSIQTTLSSGVVKYDDNESNDTDMILYGTAFNDADNYFVELKNDSEAIVVKVDLPGEVSFFTNMR